MKFDVDDLAWEKMNGLLPVIVQDAKNGAVLMQGYMNYEALQKTIMTKQVTFFSRSKNQLWTKGETSGHFLELVDIRSDCDKDTLLVRANPMGVVCHSGTTTCFGEPHQTAWHFIQKLETIIQQREQLRPKNSYTSELFNAGISRIAQKVGEEGVEVVLAAIEKNDDDFCAEVADLLFHVLVLLRARKRSILDVIKVLENRE